MSRLELRVPPDLVALVVAAFMWLVSSFTPTATFPPLLWGVGTAALALAGVVLIVAARAAFAQAATTFSPLAPGRSTTLVTSGVYRSSRNPMYLGTLLVLLALAVWLSSPVSALVTLAYAAYIHRFQIRPEERVLRDRFGTEYDEYRRRVRRWV